MEMGGVVVDTDDPNLTGLPPIPRPPLMSKALLKLIWERLLIFEEMEKDDGGHICEADANVGRGI